MVQQHRLQRSLLPTPALPALPLRALGLLAALLLLLTQTGGGG